MVSLQGPAVEELSGWGLDAVDKEERGAFCFSVVFKVKVTREVKLQLKGRHSGRVKSLREEGTREDPRTVVLVLAAQ